MGNNWKNYLLPGVYGALLTLLYQDAIDHWLARTGNADFSYCNLIPMVVAYLVWDKRRELRKVPATTSWWGLLALLPGLALFWVGELGGEFFTLFASLWLVAVGLLWLHLGWARLRTLLFPVFLSLAMFPPPQFIAGNLSLQLKLLSSRIGVFLMQLMGMSAYREGNLIDLGFTQLQVVDACSGLRYLFPIIILGLILAYFFKGAWWKKALLVLTSIPLVVFANGLRIAATGFLFQFWGPAVAEGFFHDFAGWFTFMFVLGVLLPEMLLLKRVLPDKVPPVPPVGFSGTPAVAGAEGGRFLATAATGLLLLSLTVSGSQGIDFGENTPAKQPLAGFPLQIGQWQGVRGAMEQQYIDALDFTDYLMIDYHAPQGSPINLYVAYYDSQRKGESIHSPSSCLPGGGWVLNETGLTSITVGDDPNRQIEVNRAFIQKGDARQLTYYWFPQRGRIMTGMLEMKLFNFWDALTRQRTDGALVRLVTPLAKSESIEQADRRLQAMSRQIVPLLDRYLPGKDG